MPIKNSWIFPVVQSIHLCGIAVLVGSIVIVDLRQLGVALERHSVVEIAHRFASWTRAGLAVMLITGPILFASDIPRYIHNPAFLLKMFVLLVALTFQFAVQNRIERRGKWTACISILLWTGVVLGGRAIADFDI